jgi:hypothetical protein
MKNDSTLFDVLSPDGFSIHPSDVYESKREAKRAIKEWIKRYERQGYYSSMDHGHIPLNKIHEYLQIIEL